MKLLLLGRSGSINHWLEDAVTAFRGDGHDVRVAPVRRPWLATGLERAFIEPLAANLAAKAVRFAPDLIVAIGGLHVPRPFLERLAALPGRPPLAGWVGDAFDASARDTAGLYDLLAYTDTGLAARHAALGFASRAMFLPHAASPGDPPSARSRAERLIFVGAATPGRHRVTSALRGPLTLYGPGWRPGVGPDVQVHPGRIPHGRVAGLYAAHLAVLNIKSEQNVLSGLNQRSFDPCLSGTPVLSDAQGDLERCFAPGEEVLVWRDPAELDAHLTRLLRDPAEAARVGGAGRRRVMAEHRFTHRLATLRAAL